MKIFLRCRIYVHKNDFVGCTDQIESYDIIIVSNKFFKFFIFLFYFKLYYIAEKSLDSRHTAGSTFGNCLFIHFSIILFYIILIIMRESRAFIKRVNVCPLSEYNQYYQRSLTIKIHRSDFSLGTPETRQLYETHYAGTIEQRIVNNNSRGP